jgi:hypothetical protein
LVQRLVLVEVPRNRALEFDVASDGFSLEVEAFRDDQTGRTGEITRTARVV